MPWLVWFSELSIGLWTERSQSGRMPGLRARSPAGGMRDASTLPQCCFSPSLSPFLPISLKVNKILKKINKFPYLIFKWKKLFKLTKLMILMEAEHRYELIINWKSLNHYLALAQEPVVFWRVLRLKLGSSAGGDSLRFLVDFLKPIRGKCKSKILEREVILKTTKFFRSSSRSKAHRFFPRPL